jgi:hypothetical protein
MSWMMHIRNNDDYLGYYFIIFLFRSVGLDWVHLIRQLLIGLLYQPGTIDEYGAFGGMSIGRGNRSTQRKPVTISLCPPQIPQDLTWDRTRAAYDGNYRPAAWAMARPTAPVTSMFLVFRNALILRARDISWEQTLDSSHKVTLIRETEVFVVIGIRNIENADG